MGEGIVGEGIVVAFAAFCLACAFGRMRRPTTDMCPLTLSSSSFCYHSANLRYAQRSKSRGADTIDNGLSWLWRQRGDRGVCCFVACVTLHNTSRVPRGLVLCFYFMSLVCVR